MAVGYSSYLADAWMNAVGNATSFSVTTAYIQLHTADPGAAGTTSVATENTRKAVSFGTASSNAMSNDADIDWVSVAGSETYTHFTLWDASTAGNFLWSGTVTASAITAGNDFTIATGDLDLALTIAS